MTIISSWGASDANCYIGLTDAGSFIESNMVFQTPWTDAATPIREASLIEASRDIDALQYVGERYYDTQSLEWPRSSLYPWPWNLTVQGDENLSVEQARMKAAVEKATCYQAVFILDNQNSRIHTQLIALGVSRYEETTGPLTDEYQYGGTSRGPSSLPPTVAPKARQLLSPWLTGRRILR